MVLKGKFRRCKALWVAVRARLSTSKECKNFSISSRISNREDKSWKMTELRSFTRRLVWTCRLKWFSGWSRCKWKQRHTESTPTRNFSKVVKSIAATQLKSGKKRRQNSEINWKTTIFTSKYTISQEYLDVKRERKTWKSTGQSNCRSCSWAVGASSLISGPSSLPRKRSLASC